MVGFLFLSVSKSLPLWLKTFIKLCVTKSSHYSNFCEPSFFFQSSKYDRRVFPSPLFCPSLLPVVLGTGCQETAETFGSSDGEVWENQSCWKRSFRVNSDFTYTSLHTFSAPVVYLKTRRCQGVNWESSKSVRPQFFPQNITGCAALWRRHVCRKRFLKTHIKASCVIKLNT